MKYIKNILIALFFPVLLAIVAALDYWLQLRIVHLVFPGLGIFTWPDGSSGNSAIILTLILVVLSIVTFCGLMGYYEDEKEELNEEEEK